jgi:glycosyltransferase involved in cell wall biosynthesis
MGTSGCDTRKVNSVEVSVIMPVYNAEEFLDRSIGSVLKQTFINWELICVDDGSSDGSLSLLNKYCSMNNRFRVFSQKNQGPSVARELAIKNANGKYIANLDADDFIEDDYLAKLYDQVTRFDADIVLADLMIEDDHESGNYFSFNHTHQLNSGDNIGRVEAFERTLPWRICGLGLFGIDLMKKHAVGENSRINNYNADEYITRVLFLNASKIIVSSAKYFYSANNSSITKSISERRFSSVATNIKICELTKSYGLPISAQTKANYFAFIELISSQKLLSLYGKSHFSKETIYSIQKKIKESYYNIPNKYRILLYCNKLKSKFLPATSYIFFKLSCYVGVRIKSYKNKVKLLFKRQ